MNRRTVAFFSTYVFLMVLLTGWLMNVTFSEKYVAAGDLQSSYTLTVYTTRGKIYDRNMNIIAGGASEYKAIVNPSPKSAAKLLSYYNSENLEGLEEKIKGRRPFVLKVSDSSMESDGIDIVKCEKRYGSEPIAPHITGYINNEGKGVYGIEKAYNDILTKFEGSYNMKYVVNALGDSLGKEKIIRDTTSNSRGGVVLTIDSSIQLIAQRAANEYLESGAIVIMKPDTGEILASVSAPEFEQDKIYKYLDNDKSPLINKAFSSYDVGSVFKLVVTAAALENGYEEFKHNCEGEITVGNKRFGCSKIEGHGEINFEQALAHSCNTYFVALAQNIGYETLLNKANVLGFGRKVELGNNYFTGSGNLPDESELSLPAGLANFSFGQGSLMANPVQIAALISCIANDGKYVYPYIVEKTVNSNVKTIGVWSKKPSYKAIEKENVCKIKKYMEAVMSYGTGKNVISKNVSIAAKTGTAETGIISNGRKITRGWFAGYFPADAPKFVCVVLEEDAVSGTASAGPCFKFIAERLTAIYGK